MSVSKRNEADAFSAWRLTYKELTGREAGEGDERSEAF